MEIKKGKLEKEMDDPFYLKDPQLLELYKRCLPPKEAYYYFPKGEELIEFNKKKPKKSYRKIYSDTPFLDIEKQYINDFKQILSQHPEVKIPSYLDDALLLRFIYADECDYEAVFKRLVKYLAWSEKTYPIVITPKSKLIEILNKGFVYVYGRDCRFRPILVFRLQEFVKNEKIYSVEEVIESGCFLGQFVLNNMMIPGKIERWNLIINLRGATLLSLPDHIKKLLPVMNEAFISRLHKNYVVGMTFFLRILYKLVCAFLHESTIKKIKILGGKKDQGLFEEIRKDNIEQNLGGTAPDALIGQENGLFPPRMPSDQFLLESESPEKILITEEEYIQKYNNGEIDDDFASPYILEKLNLNNNATTDNIEEKQEITKESVNIQKKYTISNISPEKSIKIRSVKTFKEGEISKINERIIHDEKLKKMKEKNIFKVKTFVYHGWDFKQEHNINHEKYKVHSNNIINEIISLSNKKKNFFQKISIISKNKTAFNSKLAYSINGNI